MLAGFAQIPFLDGNRAVVRNGHLPEREILTGVGPVAVEVPKVRDRSGNSTKYNSTLVPTYVRRSVGGGRLALAVSLGHLQGGSRRSLADPDRRGGSGVVSGLPEPTEGPVG